MIPIALIAVALLLFLGSGWYFYSHRNPLANAAAGGTALVELSIGGRKISLNAADTSADLHSPNTSITMTKDATGNYCFSKGAAVFRLLESGLVDAGATTAGDRRLMKIEGTSFSAFTFFNPYTN